MFTLYGNQYEDREEQLLLNMFEAWLGDIAWGHGLGTWFGGHGLGTWLGDMAWGHGLGTWLGDMAGRHGLGTGWGTWVIGFVFTF